MMRMHTRFALTIVVGLMLAGTSHAQDRGADSLATKVAQSAAARWLALVDSGRYAASWDSAGVGLQTAISKAEWNAAAIAARSQVDPLGQRRLTTVQYSRELPDAPPGEYVMLQYSTVARGNV